MIVRRSLLAAALLVAGPAGAQRSIKAFPAGDPGDWFGPDNYPKEAIRTNRQGRVVVALGIDSTGSVATCAVRVSSGTTALDESTCAAAREHGRFNPATDGKGRPIASTYILPVLWTLPGTPSAVDLAIVPARRVQASETFFNAAGVVTSCRVIENEPADGQGTPAMACPAAQIGEQQVPMTRDGKPVAYKVVQRLTTEVVSTEP